MRRRGFIGLLGGAAVWPIRARAQQPALPEAGGDMPVLFLQVTDPVGTGWVKSLAQPGGNITGFVNAGCEVASKWLELLLEVAPALSSVGFLYNQENVGARGLQKSLITNRLAHSTYIFPVGLHSSSELETKLKELAASGSGLIVAPDGLMTVNRELIVGLTRRLKIPAIYPFRHFAQAGGFIAYGVDQLHQWSLAATYIDRILHGENPGGLPVHEPTKFELIVNLQTARALGLTIPPSVLARADEVIE